MLKKVIVPMKQVPDTTNIKIDPKTGTLIREGVVAIMNPEDKHALEGALKLKDKHGCEVIAVTMGPPQADEILREALSMGADEGYLISDRAFAGADTLATAYTLAEAVKKIGNYDLVICGRQAIDGDTAQVGPQMAECLEIPNFSFATDIDIDGDSVNVHSSFGSVTRVLSSKMPVLITALTDLNTPRYPTIRGIIDSYRDKEIKVWTNADIKASEKRIGMNGSPTSVKRTFSPSHEKEGDVREGDANSLKEQMFEELKENNFI